MIDNFTACLSVTEKEEGGYAYLAHDPGKGTMHGVTQAVYDAYRKSIGASTRDVRLISDSELQDIFRHQYWDAVKGDLLPKGLDLAVFDEAVQSGPVEAIITLQRTLGVEPDGQFGLLTQAALPANGATAAAQFCQRRLSFLEVLKGWKFFNVDWKRRVTNISTAAQAMAR